MARIDDINAELAQIDSQIGQKQTAFAPRDISAIDDEIAQIDLELQNRQDSVANLPPEWGDVPLEALKNTPRSAIELGKNIWQAVRHPIQTGKALFEVGKGGVQKLIPGEQEAEQSFDAMVEFFKDRFGGEEALRRTISQDPVGFLTDIAAGLSAGGFILSTAGKVAKVSQITRAGQVVSKAGVVTDPIVGPLKGVAAISEKVIPGRVKSLVKSAVKFPAEKRISEVAKLKELDNLADEFITRGLKVNRTSIKNLGADIKIVQNEINTIIKAGEKRGVRIKVSEVVDGLDNLIKEIDDIPISTPDTLREARIVTSFRDKILSRQKPSVITGKAIDLTPTEVQRLKVLLNKSFTPSLETSIDAIRKVAKDKIRATTKGILEDRFPELKALNENQGVMIELQTAIAKQLRTIESGRTFGVPGLVVGGIAGTGAGIIAGAGGASLGQTLAAGITFATIAFVTEKVLTSPSVQIKIANALNFANKQAARTGKLGVVTRPAFQAGRVAEVTETPQGRTQPVQ